jgi:leucyl-tRNA synthetase
VNGKLRDLISVPTGLAQAELEKIALASGKVADHLYGLEVVRIIHVPGRLVNIVARPRG